MQSLTKKEQNAFDLYKELRSQRKCAEKMGISRRRFRDIFDSAKAKLIDTPVGFKTTKISTDAEGYPTAMTHKLAPEISDDVREGKIVRRSTLYGADGSVTGEWVIRKPDEIENEDFVKIAIDAFKAELPKFKKEDVTSNDEAGIGKLALFNIVDDHMNLKAFVEETNEEWDIEKAFELYITKFEELVYSMPEAEAAMIVNIGDQFHANDHMKVTPASKHSLDTDVPFAKAASIIIQLNRLRVEILRKKYPHVYVYGVRGNHDEDAMVLLFEALKIAYESVENVFVEYFTNGNFSILHGNSMICFDHGDKGKPEQIAGFFANESPDQFGQSKFRYIHTGHIHHDNEKDTWGGFLWRSHRTLSKRDKYSYSNKYHSPRSIKGYIYDAENGEETIRIINV